MTSVSISLLIAEGCILLIVWAFLADRRSSKREMEDLEQKQKDWLAEQKLQPTFRIRAETKGGTIYTSSPFEPTCTIEWSLRHYLSRDSSRDYAERAIENFISRGRYVHADTGIYVPLCEIKYFEVVKV